MSESDPTYQVELVFADHIDRVKPPIDFTRGFSDPIADNYGGSYYRFDVTGRRQNSFLYFFSNIENAMGFKVEFQEKIRGEKLSSLISSVDITKLAFVKQQNGKRLDPILNDNELASLKRIGLPLPISPGAYF